MLRGLVYAAAMVVVRVFQGALINAWQTQAGLISIVLLLLFIAGVVVWGVLDGRADAKAQPDPDRREDLAMTWLLAGLLAGILSGAVAWLLALVYKDIYTGGLLNELTTFAAFTALIVFVPAVIGVAFGRWRIDRNPPPRRAGDDEERADTDVFSAVRGDDAPTGEIPTQASPEARTEERPSAVAVADRGADAPTETIPTRGDDAKTEVIRTDTDARHGKPGPEQG